jgi:hypothetical protein
MTDKDFVEFVGGPMDGQRYRFTTADAVIVPDATESREVARSDGTLCTIFGRHLYHMACYANRDGEVIWQLEYKGYASP